jgi:CHAD domain-containing protein
MSASHEPPAADPTSSIADTGETVEPLLDRSAGEAARRLALRQLERARAARAALAKGDDPEALHDLRVALRRLRSLLRAFASELRQPTGRKLRRRLKRLAAATNPGRDAEVGLTTVEAWRSELAPSPEQRAAEELVRHLTARRDRAYATIDDAFLTRLDAVIDRLVERLSVWRVELRPDAAAGPHEAFRALVAGELSRHRQAFASALADAATGDVGAIHAARIEAKRLRYLLEPLANELDAVKAPLRKLRAVQDLLGEANDLAVLAAELAAEAGAAEAARLRFACGVGTRPRAADGGRRGRAALARRLARRRAGLLADFRRLWLAPRAAERRAAFDALDSAAEALAG